MKQQSKKVGIIGIVVAALLIAIMIVVDVLCSVYSGFIALYFRKSVSDTVAAADAVKAANDFTVTQEAEGLVLMKNESNTLPLKTTTKVNLFGACSVKQLYLGTGSAGGWNWDPNKFVNLKQALAAEGITAYDGLWNFYDSLSGDNSGLVGGVTDMQGSTHSIVDPAIDSYTQTVLDGAKAYSDTAIIVIGRAGGEGSDAVMDMTPANGQNTNGDPGKHYLELQSCELSMVNYVKQNYAHVILLLNTPMPVEIGFADEGIDAVMWIGLPGSTGNTAVAQAIKGTISPSGRLPDTWAYEVESAPSYYNFGDYTYDNEGLTQGNNKYLHYQEGIYVGYRWYETANAMGATVTATNFHDEEKTFNFANYDEIVQYTFGQGLSYTTFEMSWDGNPAYDSASNTLTFKVKVKNTGSVASKTPVEIYCEQPYTAGGIEKSKVVLVGFGKTGLLASGAEETVTVTVNRDELASYDSVTAKAYVLDNGDYKFYADYGKYGSHCWTNTADSKNVLNWTYNVASKVTFDATARNGDKVVATNQFNDVAKGDGIYTPVTDDVKRNDIAGTFPAAYKKTNNTANTQTATRLTDSVMGATLQGYNPDTYKYEGAYADADGNYKDPTSGFTALETGAKNGLALADLAGADYEDERWNKLIAQMSFREIQNIICNCGWQNPTIASIKKPAGVDMDGAEGLHDLVNGTSTNCYTCSPITAASFSTEVAYQMGDIYAQECIAYGVSGMYGFSMNTHRSPFGGRIFEYYSEDGLLAGYIAMSATSGLQDNGVTVFSKHFALNDQETNRGGVHTWASEQAIREIYLRPYEIIAKKGTGKGMLDGNTGIMTAYSSLGTSHASAHYPLLTNVLRGEWGFKGRVLTDAFGWDQVSTSMRAGTDMMLGFTTFDTVKGMTNDSGYGLYMAQNAVKHQLFVFANSVGLSVDTGLSNAWIAIPICVSIVLLAGAVVVALFMIIPAFKKKED